MDIYQVIKEPVFTEKAMTGRAAGCYLFKVHAKANKIEIRRAVEKLFKVKVLDVNTVTGRAKKRFTKGQAGSTGGHKKAYVKLVKGQKIEELEV